MAKKSLLQLPPAVRRTLFDLHGPHLCQVVFERNLAEDEQRRLHDAVHNFYSQGSGGPTRPMISVEISRDRVYFRKVHGRELPTRQLFEQLLLRLTQELGYKDVTESDLPADSTADSSWRTTVPCYDHTKPTQGFVPRGGLRRIYR